VSVIFDRRKAIKMKRLSIKRSALGKAIGVKGAYITLAACAVALGGAGIAAYNKTVDDMNKQYSAEPPDYSYREIQIDEKLDDVLKSDDVSSSEAADESSSKPDLSLKTQPNVMPVNGEILNAFSNGELVKSETLNVWKTHDGVDIKADKGTAVKAMNRGTVLEIWEDALWGNCITIDHGDGVIGHYYSLSPEVTVTEGDEVSAGQIIGAVGDTASCESAELSHLHFALKKNGEWIDPIAYIDPSYIK
jgi:murein DD-endopeptidase MepM/ murein hydrolase activator NlpD